MNLKSRYVFVRVYASRCRRGDTQGNELQYTLLQEIKKGFN